MNFKNLNKEVNNLEIQLVGNITQNVGWFKRLDRKVYKLKVQNYIETSEQLEVVLNGIEYGSYELKVHKKGYGEVLFECSNIIKFQFKVDRIDPK